MEGELIETGVDSLITYLKDNGKMSLKDISSAIKVSEHTLQLWVDFLVEERIIGLEYKFTKPFVFLNKSSSEDKNSSKEDLVTIDFFKKQFVDSAKLKKIPDSQIEDLWTQHLSSAIKRQKEFFIFEHKKRSLKQSSEELFNAFMKKTIEQGAKK